MLQLVGKRSSLRPVSPADYEPLRMAEMDPSISTTWRFRGRTPSPEGHAQVLWAGVLAQFIVGDNATQNAAGLVTCYEADHENGVAYLAALRFSSAVNPLPFAEGLVLFVEYIFSQWNFRNLYLDSSSEAVRRYALFSGTLLVEQARLSDYYSTGRGTSDRVILCLSRDSWARRSPRLLRSAGVSAR